MGTSRASFPNLLLGPDDASWGDEREREVMLEGYAYGYTLMLYTVWAVGAVVAWFIPAWVSVVLWLAFVIPAMEWQRFCRARQVDSLMLTYARASRARLLTATLITGGCSLSMALAVVHQLSPDGVQGGLWGAIVGGIVGGTVAFAVMRIIAKRREARPMDDDLED